MKLTTIQKSIIAYFLSLNVDEEDFKPSIRKEMENILDKLQQDYIWGNELEMFEEEEEQ